MLSFLVAIVVHFVVLDTRKLDLLPIIVAV